jgi:hypothetical protein
MRGPARPRMEVLLLLRTTLCFCLRGTYRVLLHRTLRTFHNNTHHWGGGMAQVAQHLPSKHKAHRWYSGALFPHKHLGK